MKKIWVKAIPWKKELVTAALESGADALLLPEGYSDKAKKLGIIQTIADDGDLILGKDVLEFEITSKADEKKIAALDLSKPVIIRTSDWKIIPLENLIAQRRGLIAEVTGLKEAQTAFGILEKGVDGILINNKNALEVRKIVQSLKEKPELILLKEAEIIEVKPLAMGDRVCIDTCSNMSQGEGMLIGNSSGALFLVHSESVENPYVAPRPFRVNAGPVHAYVRVGGGNTRYLSELKSGDEVMIVNFKGETTVANIGRVKIEKRPLILVEAQVSGKKIGAILQNAETIRLTQPDGKPVSVVELKKGSKVMVFLEEAGRHFGMKVDETIEEK
jgi:3-dehydroquinate synthase II